MMDLTQIEDTFVEVGGKFHTSAYDLENKMEKTKAFLFDWDGVFNDGLKGLDNTSGFSEIDSMGVNMLRFGYFLHFGKLPAIGIITGEENGAARKLAARERFDSVYFKCSEKKKGLDHFCEQHGIKPKNVCYVFDDILDIPIAKEAGIRLAVGRSCNPVFSKYLVSEDLVDYRSGSAGKEHAVREFSELLLCLMGKEQDVIRERAAFDMVYKTYLEERNLTETNYLKYENGTINRVS